MVGCSLLLLHTIAFVIVPSFRLKLARNIGFRSNFFDIHHPPSAPQLDCVLGKQFIAQNTIFPSIRTQFSFLPRLSLFFLSRTPCLVANVYAIHRRRRSRATRNVVVRLALLKANRARRRWLRTPMLRRPPVTLHRPSSSRAAEGRRRELLLLPLLAAPRETKARPRPAKLGKRPPPMMATKVSLPLPSNSSSSSHELCVPRRRFLRSASISRRKRAPPRRR